MRAMCSCPGVEVRDDEDRHSPRSAGRPAAEALLKLDTAGIILTDTRGGSVFMRMLRP
jgi:hypothetical protein